MKFFKNACISSAILFVLAPTVFSARTLTAHAAPAATKIVTTPTGYASANDVEYAYHTVGTNESVIANWGARGENCVFLSTYAQNFYKGTNAYTQLSAIKGSKGETDAHTSALFSSLQTLMTTPHTFYTYYDGSKNVRDYYEYTDCVRNDTTQVSLLYRGGLKTSEWNQGKTWNQEHMWPQSKLKTDKQIGDIMHLRPTNPSENSTRGNRAYGNITRGDSNEGFYNPGESVRGDCARTMLYMYVRWGLSSKMWGEYGVMEDMQTLLTWIAEDPVDTWEMGRNDAVQSITGTRNVFVDYPEYAWLLLGQPLPTNLVTPSSSAKSGTTETPKDETEECMHDFSDWYTLRAPTETEAGRKTRSCYECGKTETETIPALSDGNPPEPGETLAFTCQAITGAPILWTATLLVGGVLITKKRKQK